MAQRTTRPKKADVPLQIRIEVPVSGETKVFQEPVPEGFPPELFPHLADFWKRGFSAATTRSDSPGVELCGEEVSLADFAESRGRPIDDESEREGREAAKLRKKGPTFGEIARRVCRHRHERGHRCKKPCTDRIRQAMQQYESREDLRQIARGDLDS
jgi:hypothetical protein